MNIIRHPAVAGAFYPAEAAILSAEISAMLAHARAEAHGETPANPPKAIIVPHAGYIYSGPVAASAYALLEPLRGKITRVVLLGPCHRVAVAGGALSGADAFETPLGNIAIDHSLDERLLALGNVSVFDATHAQEHSLEVQLPFLQTVLGNDFKLLPIVVGDCDAAGISEMIKTVWGGDETVVVISSDLSHYLEYEGAKNVDARTCRAIENFDLDAIGDYQACGRVAVRGLLKLARDTGMTVNTLDLRNSGDTAGPRDRVVGYGAWAFYHND